MANILTKTTRFINDAAGLEKTLRFLQSFVQIIAAYSLTTSAAKPWLQARKQFALGRRYLRIIKFVDAFTFSYQAVVNGGVTITGLLEAGKWSCLGMYLLLEASTILDAMGVYRTTWAQPLFVEAMKFWFYSITCGILLSLVQFWGLYMAPNPVPKTGKADEKEEKESKEKGVKVEVEWMSTRRKIMKRLVVDSCDLFIPGSVTGWLAVSSANVGLFSVVSTVLTGTDLWTRVQGQAS
ncbi:hypothetical protein BDZ45DRAFT_356468 [Acephala macrosclerotiorum]|nr:hypothetical protein BDZ45DRAFT_356468 [Acephala macrosclerotiorum]